MNGLADLGRSRAGKKENKGENDPVELGMLELSRRLDFHRPFSITDGPERGEPSIQTVPLLPRIRGS